MRTKKNNDMLYYITNVYILYIPFLLLYTVVATIHITKHFTVYLTLLVPKEIYT